MPSSKASIHARDLPSLRLFAANVVSASTFGRDAQQRNSNCGNMDETPHAETPSVPEKFPETLPSMPPPEAESRPDSVRGAAGSASRGNSKKGVEAVGRKRKRNTGRAEWSREYQDKRARKDSRSKGGDPSLTFSKEEIVSEERKPKRKVAVMIGYSGSGYKGMQLNIKEKTIEGDLFAAFVAAGAISKANSDDPAKSSLSRCARTDKGVHAAGNVISLKLIIEDPDIVRRINENLPPQIRVWGIERTNNSFNCYQLCDSRVYEYLIPTYCFLPPHPGSILGKLVLEDAERRGDLDGYNSRQEEVLDFWPNIERNQIEPILSQLNSETRASILRPTDRKNRQAASDDGERPPQHPALRRIKALYLDAKRSYRIDPRRLQRIRNALTLYIGIHNYHNYTIGKSARDPSAKRNIKSFTISDHSPFVVNGIEWLSLRVHGQSFMMHQIRKMVAMAALCVRTGCPLERINESYGLAEISITKSAGIGFILVQPVFDNYNTRAVKDFRKEMIDFGRFEEEIREFKHREIYDRIYREEESDHGFDAFLANVDNFSKDSFNYLTSVGITNAAKPSRLDGNRARPAEQAEMQTDSEEEGDDMVKSGQLLEEG